MAHARFQIQRTPAGGLSLGYSAVQTYLKCPRLFWYGYAEGGSGVVQRNYRPNDGLLYGRLWHAGYVARMLGRSEHTALLDCLAEDNLDPGEYAEILQAVPPDLDWYFEQDRSLKVRILHAEEELRVPVGRHELRGSPDLVAEVEASWGGGVAILDHKTFSVIRGDKLYLRPYDNAVRSQLDSPQFRYYAGLWNLLHRDQPCNLGLVNFVPARVRQVLRIQAGRAGNQQPPTIVREPVIFAPERAAELVAQAVQALDDIEAKLAAGRPAFLENRDACHKPWGSCGFLPVCEDPVSRDLLIGAGYTQRTFS